MQRSGSQKVLKVISVIGIILGIISLIMALLLIVGGGLYAGSGEVVEGMTTAEAGSASIFGGLLMLLDGAVYLVEGILGLRAAKDNQKIMPVWYLATLGLALAVFSLVMGFFNGMDSSQVASNIGSLVGSGLMFWIANNVKREAGK